MTKQQAAHLRMMETLPVRTHYMEAEETRMSTRSYPDELIEKARMMDSTMQRKDISAALGISGSTLTKRLGRKR